MGKKELQNQVQFLLSGNSHFRKDLRHGHKYSQKVEAERNDYHKRDI